MSLISVHFLIFFIIILAVYYLLPGKVQWIWLLAASALFYYESSTWQQFILFAFYIAVNWIAAVCLEKTEKYRKAVYRTALIADLGMLAFFKYSGFFCQILTAVIRLFNVSFSGEFLNKIVRLSEAHTPARISYFSLILIGYLTDVYWGKIRAQGNPCKLVLFTGFFPQMTSGPIVSYEQMHSQLWGEKHHFHYENVIRGAERALWGIFKKLVISERCAMVVNTVYSYYEAYAGFYVFLAAFMFALQLYADFSGLMDIVIGVAECLGIVLPENFDTPFYSLNLSEFWRRWHITLGGFLRDYVFYPIEHSLPFKKLRRFCKNRFGKGYEKKFNLPANLALLISWFLIGLWHGGGWNYIFGVGLYMWAVIVLGEVLSPVFERLSKLLHINTNCFSFRMFQRVRTAVLFAFGLSFFRAQSLKDGFCMWRSAFSLFNPWIFFDRSVYELGLPKDEWLILLFGLLILIVVSILQQSGPVREKLHRQNYIFRLFVFLALFVMVINWGYYGMDFVAADFIYGRF